MVMNMYLDKMRWDWLCLNVLFGDSLFDAAKNYPNEEGNTQKGLQGEDMRGSRGNGAGKGEEVAKESREQGLTYMRWEGLQGCGDTLLWVGSFPFREIGLQARAGLIHRHGPTGPRRLPAFQGRGAGGVGVVWTAGDLIHIGGGLPPERGVLALQRVQLEETVSDTLRGALSKASFVPCSDLYRITFQTKIFRLHSDSLLPSAQSLKSAKFLFSRNKTSYRGSIMLSNLRIYAFNLCYSHDIESSVNIWSLLSQSQVSDMSLICCIPEVFKVGSRPPQTVLVNGNEHKYYIIHQKEIT